MKKFIAIILSSLIFLALPSLSATEHPTKQIVKSAPSAQITSLTSDVLTDLKLLQQKIDFFRERLDGQDKRISDLTFYLSLSLACFGVLMTVIVVFFSLRSTKEAVLSAKDEARAEIKEQAINIIESWLTRDGQPLITQKVDSTLRPEIDKALDEIRNAAGGVINELEEEKRKAHDFNEKNEAALAELLNRPVDEAKPLSPEQTIKVNEVAKELESKPSKEYSFKDWIMLGVQAFQSKKYEVAAEHFTKAVEVGTKPIGVAMALMRKGISLGRLNLHKEEIAIYDEIVRRYGEMTEIALREQVAMALMRKGTTLGKLDQRNDGIAVFDEVVQRFGDSSELKLCAPVARALMNKAISLGKLDQRNDGIAVFDEVVRRFGDSTELKLREQVARALLNKAIALGAQAQQNNAIVVCDEVLSRFGDATELSLLETVARALVYKAISLRKLEQHNDAIVVLDEVLNRFGDSTAQTLREVVAMSLMNKGVALGQLEQLNDAIAVYDEVVRRFGDATELALRERVARTLMNKGVALGQLEQHNEAIAVFDEVVRRFGDATELALREPVARALMNKGVALGQLEQLNDAIAVYAEVVRRFGDATELALREQVAMVLMIKGVALGKLEQHNDAIAIYDEVVRRFGDATELALRERVAMALMKKGVTLGKLEQINEEIAVYEEVARRFGDATEQTLREPTAMALNSIGFNLICNAKNFWKTGDKASAARLLEDALEKLELALLCKPDDPMCLGNQGYAFFLLGKTEKAIPILTKAIALGGDELRQGELKDADIHTLPQDKEFKVLISSL